MAFTVGPAVAKLTYLADEVTVRGVVAGGIETATPGTVTIGGEVGGGDSFDLLPDPGYAHLALPTMPHVHVETYPAPITIGRITELGWLGLMSFNDGVNQVENWPLPQKPGKAAFCSYVLDQGIRKYQPLCWGDHVEITGRLLIENGHPQHELTVPGPTPDPIHPGPKPMPYGRVFIEIHPVDFLNIRLLDAAPGNKATVPLEAPTDTVEGQLVLVAPRYDYVFGPDTDDPDFRIKIRPPQEAGVFLHVVLAEPTQSAHWFTSCDATLTVMAPNPPPPGTPAGATVQVVEQVLVNTTGAQLDQVRSIEHIPGGITVHGAFSSHAQPAVNGSSVPTAQALIVEYSVAWVTPRPTERRHFDQYLYTIRHANGSWQPFRNLETLTGSYGVGRGGQAIALATDTASQLQLALVDHSGAMVHSVHNVTNPSNPWQQLIDTAGPVGHPGDIAFVAAAPGAPGDVQFAVLTTTSDMFHAIRHSDGTWDHFNPMDSAAGNPGPPGDQSGANARPIAAAAGMPGEVQFFTIAGGGHLYHAIRHPDRSWQGFNDMTSAAGDINGPAEVSAASGANGDVHVIARNVDGTLFHAIRHSNGTWQQFVSLWQYQVNGPGPLMVSAATAGSIAGEIQVIAVDSTGGIWHAIRKPGGTWQPFFNMAVNTGLGVIGPVASVAAAPGVKGDTHFMVMTHDPHAELLPIPLQ